MKTRLLCVALAAPCSFAACADPPTSLEPEASITATEVTLVSPAPGASVAQNVATLGCPAHPHRGFGFGVRYDWEDAGAPVQAYELRVQRRGSVYPAVDVLTSDSEYADIRCNAFVIDRNLAGWEWQVRAHLPSGEAGPWSEARGFSFEPCRHEGDVPCSAPPGR
jgi:hypothetical protein